MAYPHIATKTDLAHELVQLARMSGDNEILLSHIESVLTAVCEGGLLEELPAGDGPKGRHNAALHLLSDVRDRLQQYEDRPGTEVSIALEVLATDVRNGRFSYRYVPEDISGMPSLTGQHQ